MAWKYPDARCEYGHVGTEEHVLFGQVRERWRRAIQLK